MKDQLAELILALHEQTAAINALAESNNALVCAMLEGDEEYDTKAATTTLLDGSNAN